MGKLNAVPKNGKAVDSDRWYSKDAAFEDATKQIKKLLEKKAEERPPGPLRENPSSHHRSFTGFIKLLPALLVIIGLSSVYYLFNRFNINEELKPDGEKLCHSLIGNYTLHQPYLFVETPEKDGRSRATNAIWKAKKCVPDESTGKYILKGEDNTTFNIEAIIDGKYELLATLESFYYSDVYISKDGALLGRSFEAPFTEVLKKGEDVINRWDKDADGNRLKELISIMDKKTDDLVKLRQIRQSNIKTTPCNPLLGEIGGKTTIAFVCPNYTRIIIRDRDP